MSAVGIIRIDQDTILKLIVRGEWMCEKDYLVEKLPTGVKVRSVHQTYHSQAFDFIIESEEPIEGWTYAVSPGDHIPLSERAQVSTQQRVINNAKDPVWRMKQFTLEDLVYFVEHKQFENRLSDKGMDETVYSYIERTLCDTEE
jgi:hypothetical protein